MLNPATQIDAEEVAHIRVRQRITNCPKRKVLNPETKLQEKNELRGVLTIS